MKQAKPSLEYYGTYAPLFRQQVHLLLRWGYQDAVQRIKQASAKEQEETAITGYITSAIQDRLRSLNQDRWLKNYVVKDDPPIHRDGKSGRSRPRVDIIIEATWKGRPEFCFEAKRLRRKGHEPRKYLGSAGLGCFVDGIYAQRYDEAAMLGYVQDGLLIDWQIKLKAKIMKSASELQLCNQPTDVTFPHSFPLEWQTEHIRPSIGRPITICHILLDCIPTTID